MPSANRDRVTLHCEDIGTGRPVLFLHECGGDYRSWAHKRRCSPPITTVSLRAGGYPLSDVPDDTNLYVQDIDIADTLCLHDHLGLVTSLLVGLSMGVLHNGHNTTAE